MGRGSPSPLSKATSRMLSSLGPRNWRPLIYCWTPQNLVMHATDWHKIITRWEMRLLELRWWVKLTDDGHPRIFVYLEWCSDVIRRDWTLLLLLLLRRLLTLSIVIREDGAHDVVGNRRPCFETAVAGPPAASRGPRWSFAGVARPRSRHRRIVDVGRPGMPRHDRIRSPRMWMLKERSVAVTMAMNRLTPILIIAEPASHVCWRRWIHIAVQLM